MYKRMSLYQYRWQVGVVALVIVVLAGCVASPSEQPARSPVAGLVTLRPDMQTQLVETATALSVGTATAIPTATIVIATEAVVAPAVTPTPEPPAASTAVSAPLTATSSPSSTLDPTSAPTPTLITNGQTYFQTHEWVTGAYTVRHWQRENTGACWLALGTIERSGQIMITVEDACPLVELPANDVTGEGEPDVLFQFHAGGGSHCCWGLMLFNLGATPTEVLRTLSRPYVYDGSGAFEDLNGDGRFEFVTQDAYGFDTLPCTGPTVTAIAQYDPQARAYVGASPRFAGYYTPQIEQATQNAEALRSQPEVDNKCGIAQLVALLMYSGQTERAWAEFGRFYLRPDAEEFRAALERGIRQGRFFADAP